MGPACLLWTTAHIPIDVEQVWKQIKNKEKPLISDLQVFGSRVFRLIKQPGKGKFNPRLTEMILVGYLTESEANRLLDPVTRKIVASRDIRLVENFRM